MDKVLSGSGLTIVSRNGMDPSGYMSTLNFMAEPNILMYSRKFFICVVFCITNIPFTYCNYNLGRFSTVLMAFV